MGEYQKNLGRSFIKDLLLRPIEFIKRWIQRVDRGESSMVHTDYTSRIPKITDGTSAFKLLDHLQNYKTYTNEIRSEFDKERILLPPDKIAIRIELPISSDYPRPRVFDIAIPKEMDVDSFKTKLAEKIKINEDGWEIIEIDDDNKRQRILKKNEKLDKYQLKNNQSNKKRLYFYPNIFKR